MLHPGMLTSSIFNTQQVATGWPNARNMLRPTMLRYVVLKYYDRLAGACKCWANNVAISCFDMLRSFSRGLRPEIILIIRHFHIPHNTHCLPPSPPSPPKILHNLCFPFLLGITVVPRETEDNAYAKFWGTNKVHYGGCGNGEYAQCNLV